MIQRSVICLVALLLAGSAVAQVPLTSVGYVEGNVFDADGDVFSLLDGSRWVAGSYLLLLPASDIVIVMTTENDGVTFASGVPVGVRLVSGSPVFRSGRLGQVVRERGDGALLELSDGSLWEIPSYDQYDTGYWLPPYWVVVSSDNLFILNVEEGKKVWASPVR